MTDTRRIVVGIYKNTAFCEELSLVVTGDDPEDAVRKLSATIRSKCETPVVIQLPYVGAAFSPEWESLKPAVLKPTEPDEFEQSQKVGYSVKELV